MKFTFAAVLILAGLTTYARPVIKETIVCAGIEQSAGYKLVLKAKSRSDIEDKAIAYWASLDQPDGVGYDGLIFGYKNDVLLNLKPRKNDNVQVFGSLYMDDEEQSLTYLNAEGKKIKLNLECEVQ